MFSEQQAEDSRTMSQAMDLCGLENQGDPAQPEEQVFCIQ
jgi:hypothetical protein